MLDQPGKEKAKAKSAAPALDFQQHLKALEAAGLVTRIDRPIDKDTELHPLVRWQFQGGLPEHERRAFLFTHVIDGNGRRYDMPVAVGALAASPQIYAVGMGKPVEAIETARTQLLPVCCWTSAMIVVPSSWVTRSAPKIVGSFPSGNWTSSTGPMIWTIWPVVFSFVFVAVAICLTPSRALRRPMRSRAFPS